MATRGPTKGCVWGHGVESWVLPLLLWEQDVPPRREVERSLTSTVGVGRQVVWRL